MEVRLSAYGETAGAVALRVQALESLPYCTPGGYGWCVEWVGGCGQSNMIGMYHFIAGATTFMSSVK